MFKRIEVITNMSRLSSVIANKHVFMYLQTQYGPFDKKSRQYFYFKTENTLGNVPHDITQLCDTYVIHVFLCITLVFHNL